MERRVRGADGRFRQAELAAHDVRALGDGGALEEGYYYCVESVLIHENARRFPSREFFRKIAGFINDAKLTSGFFRFAT